MHRVASSLGHHPAEWSQFVALLASVVLAACGTATQAVNTPTALMASASPTATRHSCAQTDCESPAAPIRTDPTKPSPAPSATVQDEPVCSYLDIKWPILLPGVTIAPTYRFGSTQEGQREPHHGVDMAAAAGTAVFAPAAGRVVYAATDRTDPLGPYTGFYGNVVVISLSSRPASQPIFLLFGHLSQMDVSEGQAVRAGDELGLVGSSGVAIGSHLHLEVRVGDNTYQSVRNPELFLDPPAVDGAPSGVLAGRVVDRQGRPAAGQPVTVRRLDSGGPGPQVYYLDTYDLEADTPGSDSSLKENFALGGLPPGEYAVVAFSPTLRQVRVRVSPAAITWAPLEAGEVGPSCTQ